MVDPDALEVPEPDFKESVGPIYFLPAMSFLDFFIKFSKINENNIMEILLTLFYLK